MKRSIEHYIDLGDLRMVGATFDINVENDKFTKLRSVEIKKITAHLPQEDGNFLDFSCKHLLNEFTLQDLHEEIEAVLDNEEMDCGGAA